jgi:hypothetical protein
MHKKATVSMMMNAVVKNFIQYVFRLMDHHRVPLPDSLIFP